MSLLIYSPKCDHCKDIIEFIQKNPALKSLVSYHNIHTQPIPPHYRNQINRVPTLLTKNQKFLVGQEIKAWLRSLLPPDEITNCSLKGTCGVSIDGGEEEGAAAGEEAEEEEASEDGEMVIVPKPEVS